MNGGPPLEGSLDQPLPARTILLHGGVLTLLTALAWVVLTLASVQPSWGERLSHDRLLGAREVPLAVAVPLFLAAWVVMSAAMMLPTVWPILDRFLRAVAVAPERSSLQTALFLGGYFAVWGAFGLAVLVMDGVLHGVVEILEPPAGVTRLIGPATIMLAGAFQFTRLKTACLTECRSPVGFLVRYWRPGLRGALSLGLRHGLFCLGCCWALMLVMFGVGVTNLGWMLALTVLFYVEKSVATGQAFSQVIGIGLLVMGAAMVVGFV